jgi:hypothetical protein
MKEKTNVSSGILISIALAWAGWVSVTLYSQNGTISSLASNVNDNKKLTSEVLGLLSGKDTIPINQLTELNN